MKKLVVISKHTLTLLTHHVCSFSHSHKESKACNHRDLIFINALLILTQTWSNPAATSGKEINQLRHITVIIPTNRKQGLLVFQSSKGNCSKPNHNRDQKEIYYEVWHRNTWLSAVMDQQQVIDECKNMNNSPNYHI